MYWFWVLYLPGLLLGLWSLRGERRRSAFYRSASAGGDALPPATVIVPVKGLDEGLAENLASLGALDYPDYELIVVAAEASDVPAGVAPSLIAGRSGPVGSAKVANLLAAVRAARPESEVFAFADSDGRVQPGWLRALVAPLSREGVGASTGYRWYTPQPPDFWSVIRSVWNAGIFGQFGGSPAGFAWGGAMAVRRDVFERLRVAERWRIAVSDDYALSGAVRDAGLSVAYATGAVVASVDHVSAREFFAWARRQMILTRVYAPRLWRTAFVATVLYCLSMAACVIAVSRGAVAAEYALLAALFPAMLKGANRAGLARVVLPGYTGWFKRFGWVHTWFAPLVTWVWLVVLVLSAWGNEIEWRGRRYRLGTQESDESWTIVSGDEVRG